jgi:mRNA interferase MazF
MLSDKPSAVLVNQIRTIDWHSRNVKFQGKVDPRVLAEIRGKLAALLLIEN